MLIFVSVCVVNANLNLFQFLGELSFEAYSALLEQIQEETPDPDFDVLNNLGASEEVDATLYSKGSFYRNFTKQM